MNEFSLITSYFKHLTPERDDVIVGVGDDAACIKIPDKHQLVITTDTLVSGVHFLPEWSPFDIAFKAVMVNVSDLAAMAALPCWATVALTLPEAKETWVSDFSKGLKQAFSQFNIALIGGDLTRGPLSISITLHGIVPDGQAVRRRGAEAGDHIFVSGELGAPALAVTLSDDSEMEPELKTQLMRALIHPQARVDFLPYLREYATAAIDISDGLSADLQHICDASAVGACLDMDKIPVHGVVKQLCGDKALDFALSGGDDYQLCFTVPAEKKDALKEALMGNNLQAFCIGVIEHETGLRVKTAHSPPKPYQAKGYSHF